MLVFFPAGRDTDLSELLPTGWTSSEDGPSGTSYAVRYRDARDESSKYLLRVVSADASLVVSLVRFADEKVATATVVTADHVDEKDNTKVYEIEKALRFPY